VGRKAQSGEVDAVEFFKDFLRHTKDPYAGLPFELRDWQEKILRDVFGTLNPDGTRQYRTVYEEIPRKNGKTEKAAGVALYMLFGDGERGAEVYSAAADKEQASICFNVAATMVRLEPYWNDRCKIYDRDKKIVFPEMNSVYQALSAEHATKHGFNASAIIFDELHAQPNRALWDVLTTSGGTRRQPLVYAITTAGFDRNSICWEIHEYAERVIKGIVDDPTFYGVIYAAPENADWTDEKVWFACNPALDDFRNLDELRSLCKRAQEIPAFENTFRRLYLNQWTKQESRYLPMQAWDACDETFDPGDLRGRPFFAGLDLATKIDISAFVMACKDEEGNVYLLPHFWVPEENIEVRARRDKVPYDLWARQGFITPTPGNVVDQERIRADILALRGSFDIREIAFDSWNTAWIAPKLEEDGITMVDFRQGYRSMSGPTKDLLVHVMGKKIRHNNNPVLRWMADNVVVTTDAAENVKPDKSKSTERIDGIVAAVMALDRLTKEEPESVYNTRGLVSI